MDYMSTDFGGNCSSHFPFRTQTDVTERRSHAGSCTAGVGNNYNHNNTLIMFMQGNLKLES